MIKEARIGRVFVGRIPLGADLLTTLTDIAREHGVALGKVEAIGAVQRARIGYYRQDEKNYEFLILDEPLEIVSLFGDVSLKDREPTVHAHAVFSRADGTTAGGHIAVGTPVFACEFVMTELVGALFSRSRDEDTGLPLWKD